MARFDWHAEGLGSEEGGGVAVQPGTPSVHPGGGGAEGEQAETWIPATPRSHSRKSALQRIVYGEPSTPSLAPSRGSASPGPSRESPSLRQGAGAGASPGPGKGKKAVVWAAEELGPTSGAGAGPQPGASAAPPAWPGPTAGEGSGAEVGPEAGAGLGKAAIVGPKAAPRRVQETGPDAQAEKQPQARAGAAENGRPASEAPVPVVAPSPSPRHQRPGARDSLPGEPLTKGASPSPRRAPSPAASPRLSPRVAPRLAPSPSSTPRHSSPRHSSPRYTVGAPDPPLGPPAGFALDGYAALGSSTVQLRASNKTAI